MNNEITGCVIDLDGTVYRGKQAIEGAIQAIDELKAMGKQTVFLSNRGNMSREACCERLIGMGLESVKKEEILLSSTVTARYVKKHYPRAKVWTLGDEGLRDELRDEGVAHADKPELADWLIITLHETLTYRELNAAFRAVRHGAGIIATNADKTFPGEDGESIDVGGMIGAITASTGKEVDVVIGKPSRLMADAALETLGLPPEKCVVIGDSLESDVALGKQAGMKTALVLTGSVNRKEAEASGVQPDWIWDSLADARQLAILTTERSKHA